jgi:hypothetical protein
MRSYTVRKKRSSVRRLTISVVVFGGKNVRHFGLIHLVHQVTCSNHSSRKRMPQRLSLAVVSRGVESCKSTENRDDM